MELQPLDRSYFAPVPDRERVWRLITWVATLALAAALFLFWEPLRGEEFVRILYRYQETGAVEVLFRSFTFLGDDEFYMIFFSVLIWCASKTLGFWVSVVLLTSGTVSHFVKEITLLDRPAIDSVRQPGNHAFPSGHTLTAVTVWGYLAVRLKSKGFWIWTAVVITMIAVSRVILGYHFPGDILGGLVIGFIFLAFFLWISAVVVERNWDKRVTLPLVLLLVLLVLPGVMAVTPGRDLSMLMGYLAGASLGYAVEKEKLRSTVKGAWYKQVVKVVLGLVVLFVLVEGLGGVLPEGEIIEYIHFALAGLWVTLIAPALFVLLRLSYRSV